MEILENFQWSSFATLNISELENEKMGLRKQIDRTSKEKKEVAMEIFHTPVTRLGPRHPDGRIKNLNRKHISLFKQLKLVSDLVIIKQYENELRQSAVWSKITATELPEFENKLAGFCITDKNGEDVIAILNYVFGISPIAPRIEEPVMDDIDKQLIEAWSGVETGAIDDTSARTPRSGDNTREDINSPQGN